MRCSGSENRFVPVDGGNGTDSTTTPTLMVSGVEVKGRWSSQTQRLATADRENVATHYKMLCYYDEKMDMWVFKLRNLDTLGDNNSASSTSLTTNYTAQQGTVPLSSLKQNSREE